MTLSELSGKNTVQRPAYGLRDRCPNIWIAYRKCLHFAPDPANDCKDFMDDYHECMFRVKQKTWERKLEAAIERQREKFTNDVNKEIERLKRQGKM